MSLFTGSPQQAPSYTTSSTETPKWMQDAIYNQIQVAQNVANRPFEQYAAPRVAELSPLQQQAYANVRGNQGAWQVPFRAAGAGTALLADAKTAGLFGQAQDVYLRPDLVGLNLQNAQSLANQASNINAPAQAKGYIDQGLGFNPLAQAQPYLTGAGQLSTIGSAQPYYAQAGQMSGLNAAQPYMQGSQALAAQAAGGSALGAAAGNLTAAGQSAVGGIQQYMNPFTSSVTDQIARLGARNLSENLLPSVSDAFVRAGQFGSNRMGEFGARALRDTQESVLREQAQALQQGYGQALGAAQTDAARQAQLAGTAGQLAGTDLARQLQASGQFSALGQMAGQLTGQ
jgi:hypothetical protein